MTIERTEEALTDLERPWGAIPFLKERDLATWQQYVLEFHQIYGHAVGAYPQTITEDQKKFRLSLIKEEVKELKKALAADDLVETYDACIDIIWVTLGLMVVSGMDAAPGFDVVRESNLSKLGEDGKPILSRGIEEDGYPVGKVLKGPNYVPPTEGLAKVLFMMGMDESEM